MRKFKGFRVVALAVVVAAGSVPGSLVRADSGASVSAQERFARAQELIRAGQPEAAARILSVLVREFPESNRVKLDHAATLFALGRDEEAEALFRAVWEQTDLPPPVRRNVEDFLEAIHARRPLRVDLHLGFWSDDNVNNASEPDTVEVPRFGGLPFTPDERPIRAWVARTGVGLRSSHPVSDDGATSLETRSTLVRDTAVGASAHNRTWAGVSGGPKLRYAPAIGGRPRPGSVAATAGVERRWRGGRGDAVSVWAGLGVEQQLTPDGLSGGLLTRHWRTRYDGGAEGDAANGRRYAAHAGKRVGRGTLRSGVAWSSEGRSHVSSGWTAREVWLGYGAWPDRDIRLSGELRFGVREFDTPHVLFLTRRSDRTRVARVSASHRRWTWRGYLPELTFEWRRTRSNIPLYERNTKLLTFNLHKLF